MEAMSAGWCVFSSAIGACGIAWRDGLIVGAQLPEEQDDATRARMHRRFPALQESDPPPWVQRCIDRTQAVLEGGDDDLADIPLAVDAVAPFHQRVFSITRAIPPGRTRTYGDIATELGEPGSARAVGQALGANPFAPIVPCHRVVGARSAVGGFSAAGGLRTKLRMLEIEHAELGGQPGLFDR